MNIGEVSKLSSVSAKMIRYYEQIGLTPQAQRNEAGYRKYTQVDVSRLNFIRRARGLGFALVEIGDLLALWDNPSRKSADVKLLAEKHSNELERRIVDMQQMVDALKTLMASCAGNHSSDCSILDGLEHTENKTLE